MAMILRFIDNKLKKGLVSSIERFKNCNNRHLYIEINEIGIDCDSYNIDDTINYVNNIKCICEEYTVQECETLDFCIDDGEYIITGQENVNIYMDDAESVIEMMMAEFIRVISEIEQVSINDDGVCIINNLAILRVVPNDFIFESLYEFTEFEKTITYQNRKVTLITSTHNELYYLKVFFDGNFDDFNPVILDDDLFIEIYFEENRSVSIESVLELFNAYIYEIFITYGYKLVTNPRSIMIYEAEKIHDIDLSKFCISDSLFSKGMKDILLLFNGAEGYNDDRAIVEYVKVIEYISVTVIRQEVTLESQKKLLELKSYTPSADYIKELGDIFIKYNKRLKSDSELIKATIKQCCDVEALSKYSPKFIKSLFKLKRIIDVDSCDRQNLIDQAKNDLAQSISDTRNNISHAKANYQNRGYECPDNQKKEFIILLRNVCVQVIRWFYNTDENVRIIKEIL